jgi:TolB protein
MFRWFPGELTVKSLRSKFMLLAGPFLGLFFAPTWLAAQNPMQSTTSDTNFVVYDVLKGTTTTLFSIAGEWHAPNWTTDGRYVICDHDGSLYRIPMSGAGIGKPEKIYQSAMAMLTNDHALSWDGKQIAVTGIALPFPKNIEEIRAPMLIMKMDGSSAHEVHLGWLHGWSPDGKYLVYTGFADKNADVYRVGLDGSGELRMTMNIAEDDGPEYSADGKWVYFCSKRSGKWDAWRMPANGAGPDDNLAEKITHSEDTQDWFPHISSNGKWLYTISYPIDHADHSYIGDGMKIKLLRLTNGVGAKGAELTTVRTFHGGQGAGNTGGWSPDSKKIVWTEYEKSPQQAK